LVVPEGYKRTEVGVIPDGWEVNTIGNLFVFKNGLNKSKEYFGYGTPIVNYTDVYSKNGIYATDINGNVCLSNNEIKRYQIQKGDIFFTRTSETPEEVGISSVLLEEIPNGVFSGFVLRGRPLDNSLDDCYKKYCFQTEHIRNAIIQGCTYTTRALTNGTQLSKIYIPVPPVPEQVAIAEALTDVDSLIESLEKLVAKKKDIKQGAMQELLTGKRRLEGFGREWEEKAIDNIAIVGRGRVISHKEIERATSKKYPVFSSQTANNGIMGYLDTFDFEGEYITWTTDGVNAGTVFPRSGRFNCTNVCGTLKLIVGNNYFIANRLSMKTNEYVSINLANPKLMNNVMKSIIITIPPTLDEQTAIANILSDMDDEIEKLTIKLNKYKQIKQGMMQELLTGKRRLI